MEGNEVICANMKAWLVSFNFSSPRLWCCQIDFCVITFYYMFIRHGFCPFFQSLILTLVCLHRGAVDLDGRIEPGDMLLQVCLAFPLFLK